MKANPRSDTLASTTSFETAAQRVADGERHEGNDAYNRGDLVAAEAAYSRLEYRLARHPNDL